VRLLPTTNPEEFARLALDLPATQKVAFVTGRFDYIVELACGVHGYPHRQARAPRGGHPGQRGKAKGL
jgi:hypothetical protein